MQLFRLVICLQILFEYEILHPRYVRDLKFYLRKKLDGHFPERPCTEVQWFLCSDQDQQNMALERVGPVIPATAVSCFPHSKAL
jgi:hypothetical protein